MIGTELFLSFVTFESFIVSIFDMLINYLFNE